MRTFVQRLAAALLTLLAFAAPAAAAGHHHGPRAIASVKLVPLPGGGTLIHVRGAGQGRAVLHSPDLIAAAAIRDVDADGDLDVIADSGRGLLVWRNLGSGRYVLAAPPSKERLHRRAGPGLAAARQPTESSGIGEQRQQLAAPGARLTTRVAPATTPTPPSPARPRASAAQTHAGRAPPVHA